ncbi:hypothetical protein H8711_02015 [Clostridiaceae bacterium NSJ-31]|uniref:Uncharacterized protein n=1 Tax=Ligaoa zhengdingensis TaxID=2763658 RepID=A0A926DYD4_9FIRM|nr:hypothetical protein [Ligaoa zhengdingensis]MBC8545714.1 hypothetical protein [Ligaoa zhengdingensis]
MRLYLAECRRILFSLTWVVMAAVFVIFAVSQDVLPPSQPLQEPRPGGSYGGKASGNPDLIMPEALESLYGEFSANDYTTYPHGFIKTVRLKEKKRVQMAGILSELTGKPADELLKAGTDASSQGMTFPYRGDELVPDEDGEVVILPPEAASMSWGEPIVSLAQGVTWDRFQELMGEVDRLVGGGSSYAAESLSSSFGMIPRTYEEAVADYRLIVSHDRFTGAHARLFSDYMGCMMGLLPVFLSVGFAMRDTREIRPAIYVREASSVHLVLARFAALVTLSLLPALLMGAVLTGLHIEAYGAASVDLLAYPKYILAWLLPTAMAAISVGLFFTTLTGTPAGVAVQLIWWFLDLNGGLPGGLTGNYAGRLSPRHNSLGATQVYLDHFGELVRNRAAIALIALILVGLTIAVLEGKRRGKLDVSLPRFDKRDPKA